AAPDGTGFRRRLRRRNAAAHALDAGAGRAEVSSRLLAAALLQHDRPVARRGNQRMANAAGCMDGVAVWRIVVDGARGRNFRQSAPTGGATADVPLVAGRIETSVVG